MKWVLVVDDEPSILQLISDLLRDEAYGVLVARSGREMLTVLETERPDLILLDVMMPDGDGREALHLMQAQPQLRDIPVVMMSAGVDRQQVRELATTFLAKPFDLEDLLRTVVDTIGPGDASTRS